jgi:CDP-diacylglycerol--glycerol-3-phosphate 3-phosphatidyltransferase
MTIPQKLILFRFLISPLIIVLAWYFGDSARMLMVFLMVLGILSDIFDGIIARRMNISSVKLRRLDSQVDLVFWLSIGLSSYILNPEIITEHKMYIVILFLTEGLCYLTSFIKFGKETCTHAFLSKIWGITLLVCFIALIGFGHGGIPLKVAVYWGLISQLDVILIVLLLPKWQNDIPSFYHAYLIRKGIPFSKNKLLND